jgi:hypothetical protein
MMEGGAVVKSRARFVSPTRNFFGALAEKGATSQPFRSPAQTLPGTARTPTAPAPLRKERPRRRNPVGAARPSSDRPAIPMQLDPELTWVRELTVRRPRIEA